MNHVMIDLETLGTGADAVILSIAAVRFDLYTPHTFEKFPELEFYRTGINIDQGRRIDDGTFRWWMGQSEAARAEHFKPEMYLSEALGELYDFFNDGSTPDVYGVWGNGADFDNAVLQQAWQRFQMGGQLYPYWANRCFRTFTALFDPNKNHRPASNDHNALNDCRNQIRWMWNVIRELEMTEMSL